MWDYHGYVGSGFHARRQCVWCVPGRWAVVSGYRFLMFRLHLWKTSSEMAASEVPEVRVMREKETATHLGGASLSFAARVPSHWPFAPVNYFLPLFKWLFTPVRRDLVSDFWTT